MRNAELLGDCFCRQPIQKQFSNIMVDVRGKGLMIGMEFPDDVIGYDVAKGLFNRGVLVAGTLINAEVIRVQPPLTIPLAEVDRVLECLEGALKDVQRGVKVSTDGGVPVAQPSEVTG